MSIKDKVDVVETKPDCDGECGMEQRLPKMQQSREPIHSLFNTPRVVFKCIWVRWNKICFWVCLFEADSHKSGGLALFFSPIEMRNSYHSNKIIVPSQIFNILCRCAASKMQRACILQFALCGFLLCGESYCTFQSNCKFFPQRLSDSKKKKKQKKHWNFS